LTVGGKITAIESAAEGLPLTVYVDGRPTLKVTREMVERLGLKVGMNLGSAETGASAGGPPQEPEEDDELRRARDAALRLLAVRARSVAEVRNRLARKGFSPESVSAALRGLEGAGLLDDREFARLWAEERVRLRPVGPRRLRSELASKGVPPGVIEETLRRTYEEHDERELADRVLRKRRIGKNPDAGETRRLRAFLLRRGFGYEAIDEAVKRACSENDDAETDV